MAHGYIVFSFSIQATLIYQYDYAFIHIHTCSATWHMHLCLCMSAVSFTCMSSCVCACMRVRMPAVTCMMFCMQLGHPHTSHTSSVYSYTTYTQTYKLSYLLEYMLMYTQTCTSRSVSAHTHKFSRHMQECASAHTGRSAGTCALVSERQSQAPKVLHACCRPHPAV